MSERHLTLVSEPETADKPASAERLQMTTETGAVETTRYAIEVCRVYETIPAGVGKIVAGILGLPTPTDEHNLSIVGLKRLLQQEAPALNQESYQNLVRTGLMPHMVLHTEDQRLDHLENELYMQRLNELNQVRKKLIASIPGIGALEIGVEIAAIKYEVILVAILVAFFIVGSAVHAINLVREHVSDRKLWLHPDSINQAAIRELAEQAFGPARPIKGDTSVALAAAPIERPNPTES